MSATTPTPARGTGQDWRALFGVMSGQICRTCSRHSSFLPLNPTSSQPAGSGKCDCHIACCSSELRTTLKISCSDSVIGYPG